MERVDSRAPSLLHQLGRVRAEPKDDQRKRHMQKRTDRKSARGGRALLAGLVRCGRCGRMMRVFYGSTAGHAQRYQCRGADGTTACVFSSLAGCGKTPIFGKFCNSYYVEC